MGEIRSGAWPEREQRLIDTMTENGVACASQDALAHALRFR
jgi:hypothetical protein